LAAKADHERLTMLKAGLPNERLEIRQNLPLVTLALELRNCALFLGHDTRLSLISPRRLGVAVRCSLYGPTDPAFGHPGIGVVRILRAPGINDGGNYPPRCHHLV
jgi:hypothetical protein